MKLRIYTLPILLVMLFGLAACGEKATPTPTAATVQEPTDAPTEAQPEPTDAPTEVVPEPTATPDNLPGFFSREQLIEDARQLADILESAHPDPYINGGGRIAFHRRLHKLLNSIPEEGMTRDEFARLLNPFVVAVGDSHTAIWDVYQVNDAYPGGIPLQFAVVEQSLYVAGAPSQYWDFLGSRLVSVEGVPLDELRERQNKLSAAENEYHVLQLLAGQSLRYAPYMEDLIPEWQDTGQITAEFQLPSGEIQETVFTDLPMRDIAHVPASTIRLPFTDNSGFTTAFLDPPRPGKEIAYLRVDHMTGYRETLEVSDLVGASEYTDAQLANTPSATETFRDLVIDMERRVTDTLIVDLRDNGGGSSLMANILIYFLYGKDTLFSIVTHAAAAGGGEIRRYSELYFENQTNRSIDDFNEGREVPLIVGDYDFSAYFEEPGKFEEHLKNAEVVAGETWYQMTPTFYAEYESGEYSGYYLPENVVVLVTPRTFSSGFTLMRYLYFAGATLVGTPSAQAANCFGEADFWQLNHTGIRGIVSHGYYVEFPDDPELGRVIPVHYPMTYELLASYGFDPNAEYLYALDLLPELGE